MPLRSAGSLPRAYFMTQARSKSLFGEKAPFFRPNDWLSSSKRMRCSKAGDEYILLIRDEGLEGKSFFALARSKNGFDFDIEETPFMEPAQEIPLSIY